MENSQSTSGMKDSQSTSETNNFSFAMPRKYNHDKTPEFMEAIPWQKYSSIRTVK